MGKLEHLGARLASSKHWLRGLDWRRITLWGGVIIVALIVVAQVLYPADRMPLFSHIDGQDLTWQTRSQAISKLDQLYADHTVDIYMTGDSKPVVTPKLSSLDITINNSDRVNQFSYPWYWRIVPTSMLWIGLHSASQPVPAFGDKFESFISASLMPSCQKQPVDATLEVDGTKLSVVADKSGRSCKQSDVVSSIKKISPSLTSSISVHVGAEVLPAGVLAADAQSVADDLNSRLIGGIDISTTNQTVTAPAKDVVTWLNFASGDHTVKATLDGDKVVAWLGDNISPKVAVAPGTSYITTVDFTETSRQNGASGQALDEAATTQSLQSVIDGQAESAIAITKVIPPNEKYTRSYSPSDQGLSALMTNFAHDHSGTFGISMIELDGKKRRADFSGDKQFVTASTYKLFVAYSLLKQIDAGKRDWSSSADCFNKMISLSDNTCAENFLKSIGQQTITNDIQAVGLVNSTFMKPDNIYSTPNDLALMLGMIATGQNFSFDNQQRLISAMKSNVYRKGIPAGVEGTVADKVGFMWGLLHDAAIVYGPHGTYVLAVMTDGNSWGTIADLARQIDQLHAQ